MNPLGVGIGVILLLAGVLLAVFAVSGGREAQCTAAKDTLIQEDNYKRMHAESMSRPDLDRWAQVLKPCTGGLP